MSRCLQSTKQQETAVALMLAAAAACSSHIAIHVMPPLRIAEFANQTIVDLRRSPMTLVQIATDPAFSIQAVMDLPFTTFFMYIKIDSIHTSEVGISKFTEYLMRRYQGTGKTFMLGVPLIC